MSPWVNHLIRYAVAGFAAIVACCILTFTLRHTIWVQAPLVEVKAAVFDIMPFNRPALQLDSSFFEESLSPEQEQKKAPANTDVITAKAYLVGNIRTGKIYLQEDDEVPMPLASMSKLITAITEEDVVRATSSVAITDADMALPPDTSNLHSGELFTVPELFFPMLLSSSNIAAEAVARAVNRDTFIALMNKHASDIGMQSAFFADPSGLDPRNMASAHDMFVLAQYLYLRHQDILKITHMPDAIMASTTEHAGRDILSTHPFVYDGRFIGGKTGRTPEAGETMLTILKIGNEPIVFIVLGSAYGSREWDTKLLVDKFTKEKTAP